MEKLKNQINNNYEQINKEHLFIVYIIHMH